METLELFVGQKGHRLIANSQSVHPVSKETSSHNFISLTSVVFCFIAFICKY